MNLTKEIEKFNEQSQIDKDFIKQYQAEIEKLKAERKKDAETIIEWLEELKWILDLRGTRTNTLQLDIERFKKIAGESDGVN